MCTVAQSMDPDVLKRKRVVLVVEDDVLIRLVTAEYLRDAGFTVVEASDSHDAIAIFGSQTVIDLVFSDINMPGDMDGHSLANWLLMFRPPVPVILTSGAMTPLFSSDQKRRRFMRKPYALIEVEQQIRELLDWPRSIHEDPE
jgi:CheY-like chemotaxis protein